MESNDAVEALVVGGVDTGDADRVVHLLTAQGRLAVFAPQAKRSRRRFTGALEPFTTVEFQLAARRTKAGLRTVSDATVLRSRLPLRRSLDAIGLASYVGELGFRTAPEGQACEIAPLVEQVWEQLCEAPATRRLRRAFELRLMTELGYQPELTACIACGDPADPGYLDLARGGLLCSVHRGGAQVIGPKTAAWLIGVLSADGLSAAGGLAPEDAEKAATKVSRAFGAFWTGLLDRPLKATALLAEVEL